MYYDDGKLVKRVTDYKKLMHKYVYASSGINMMYSSEEPKRCDVDAQNLKTSKASAWANSMAAAVYFVFSAFVIHNAECSMYSFSIGLLLSAIGNTTLPYIAIITIRKHKTLKAKVLIKNIHS